MYKYKIKTFMDTLPYVQYVKLNRNLPGLIGVSRNSYWNYCNIKIGSKRDIPYSIVKKLEIIFGMKPGELINQHITAQYYSKVVDSIPTQSIRRVRKRTITDQA